jgi:hypothetical protein
LRVAAEGLAPIEVELRVTEPPAGTSVVGTVVLGSGDVGMTFYGDLTDADLLVGELASLGFRVVDRRWSTPWFEAGSGILEQSARYATLLVWIHENLHTGGGFGATGNSAGGGEIAYALTKWHLGDRLDVAVLTSGPPFTRLDYFCDDPPLAEWASLCSAVVPDGVFECAAPTCTPEPGNPLCPVLPVGASSSELEADSILFPGATLDFPDTALFGVFGTRDCTSAVPMGLVFFDAVASPTTISYASGAPHAIAVNPNGRDAIVQALAALLPPSSAPAAYVRLGITVTAEGAAIFGEIARGTSRVQFVGFE